jgi:choline/glycine/proline betaine transport protein
VPLAGNQANKEKNMANWRKELKRVIEEEANSPPAKSHATVEKARKEISRFISRTALPALEALKEELEQYERRCEIERRDYQVSLTVFHADHEEFSYVVRGRAYHQMFFAFPEFGDPGKDSHIGRAEVMLNKDRMKDEVSEITRETIITDFIQEYASWLGQRPDEA